MQYCDLEYAEAYFLNRLNTSAWDSSSDMKIKALANASRDIYDFCEFYDEYGVPFRYDMEDSETVEIPDDLKAATCEQALYLLNLGFDPRQPKKVNTLGIISTDGTVFDKDMTAGILCDSAIRLIKNMGGEILSGANNSSGVSCGYFTK